MRRHELTDEHWARLEPLLPPQKPLTGRPAKDHRTILNGILWVLKTGAPWRDLPEYYGPWRTVYSCFTRWQRVGIWQRILTELQQEAHDQHQVDWSAHMVDGTVIRAHQHAAGARRTKGGWLSKRSDAAEVGSVPSCISRRIAEDVR
jgi:transposase